GSALADPQGDGAGTRIAADPDRGAPRRSRACRARAAEARTAAEDERRVLLGPRARRRRRSAAARAGDVRVLARGPLVCTHPRAEAHGAAVPALRPPPPPP